MFQKLLLIGIIAITR